MRLLARLILVPLGIGCAVTAGLLFLMLAATFQPALAQLFAGLSLAGLLAFFDALTATGDAEAAPRGALLALWMLTVGVVALPPAVIALVGEFAGWRSFVWYSGATALLTASLPWIARGSAEGTRGEADITLVLFLTGALAGLVHWAIAGRTAGGQP
ncbi:MFS domain-containing protein [Hyphomicrobiales bacterium]|nr:MFS domain-containing protein [Hyphomicrobiales bacterium]CAH1679941.1 MFS domain-containing protein [Hyphomicrobiales bacterium]